MAQSVETAWDRERIKALAPHDIAWKFAERLRAKGALGPIEPTADGRGWWATVRDRHNYQLSVRRRDDTFDCFCECAGGYGACSHALAVLFHLADHPEARTEAPPPRATTGDYESLLRAVFAHPDDDTPRLVFADYLQENGEPDRAALIRYQCEQARVRKNTNRHKELTRLIDKLVPNLRKETGIFPFGQHHSGMQFEFRRGFLHLDGYFDYFGDLGAVPARFVNLFRDGWVEAVHTFISNTSDFERGWLPLVAHVAELDVSKEGMHEPTMLALISETAEARRSGRLARIRVARNNQKEFDRLMRADRGETVAPVSGNEPYRHFTNLTPHTLQLLSRTGRLSGARHLWLGGQLGDADVPALLAADLTRLEALSLGGWNLSRAGTADLLNGLSRRAGALKTLAFLGGGPVSACVAALAGAHGPAGVQTLLLNQGGLLDADAAALATAKGFPNLAVIDLERNGELTAVGAAALLASDRLKLARLSLGDTEVAPTEFLPLLLDAPDREFLTLLSSEIEVSRWARNGEVEVEIAGEFNTDDYFSGLAGCAGATRVTTFAAPNTGLPATALPLLAAAFDPAKLWKLDLSDNRLGSAGAAALAAAFGRFRLRELNLSECEISTAGVVALAKSPFTATVEKLNLSRSAPGKGGVAALLKMNAPALKELVLTGCGLAAPERRQLKKHFGPRVQL